MIKTYFDICGIKICLEGRDVSCRQEYAVFSVNDSYDVDIYVRELMEERKGGLDDAAFSFSENDMSWYVSENGGLIMVFTYQFPAADTPDHAIRNIAVGEQQKRIIYVNRDFSRVEYANCMGQSLSQAFFQAGGEVIHRYHIIYHGGMVMHAVSINYQGESILFSGVSGMGKTTQADLWGEFTGSHIINGDRATLVYRGGRLITTGSAWSGTSRIFLNETAPIKAIVFLEQAAFNQLIELTPQAALSYMVPRCFLPYYSQEFMAAALSNVDKITRSIPMFLLRNKADRQSVEMMRQVVFGD